MGRLSSNHENLDEQGQGLCSVPMWSGGGPSGFCDKPAFGNRPRCREMLNPWSNEMVREDGRYAGYVPALACIGHGGPKYRTFLDGNVWCAVEANFEDLAVSDAGFGDTKEEAIKDLIKFKEKKDAKI